MLRQRTSIPLKAIADGYDCFLSLSDSFTPPQTVKGVIWIK